MIVRDEIAPGATYSDHVDVDPLKHLAIANVTPGRRGCTVQLHEKSAAGLD